MKIIAGTSIILLLMAMLFYKAGYEVPGEDVHPEIPYFPSVTQRGNYANVAIDTMNIVSCDADRSSGFTFILYNQTSSQSKLLVVNQSFRRIYHHILPTGSLHCYDAITGFLYVVPGGGASCDAIDLKKNEKKIITELDEKEYTVRKDSLLLVGSTTDVGSALVLLKSAKGSCFFIRNELAAKIAKDFVYDKNKELNTGIRIKVGGDPDNYHRNIQLSGQVLQHIRFKGWLHLGTPSSSSDYDGSRRRRYEQNEGYANEKGMFDKDYLYYFRMKLKSSEVSFKSRSYYYSDTFFEQLNDPQSDQDTLFYYSKHKIYKFFLRGSKIDGGNNI